MTDTRRFLVIAACLGVAIVLASLALSVRSPRDTHALIPEQGIEGVAGGRPSDVGGDAIVRAEVNSGGSATAAVPNIPWLSVSLGETGKPVENCAIFRLSEEYCSLGSESIAMILDGPVSPIGLTDGAGQFLLPDVLRVGDLVVARCSTASSQVFRVQPGRNHVTLSPYPGLEVQVLFEGEPVSGAEVRLLRRSGACRGATTDVGGVARFAAVSAETFQVSASHALGSAYAESRGSQSPLVLELSGGFLLSVTALDASTGVPVDRGSVEAVGLQERYFLKQVSPGVFQASLSSESRALALKVMAAGYATLYESIRPRGGTDPSVEQVIYLAPHAGFFLRTIDASGMPVANAVIVAEGRGALAANGGRRRMHYATQWFESNEEGIAQIPMAHGVSWTGFVATDPRFGWGTLDFNGGAVRPAPGEALDIVLARGRTIVVRCSEYSSNTMGGETVVISPRVHGIGSPFTMIADFADAGGVVEFDVPSGAWTVQVRRRGAVLFSKELDTVPVGGVVDVSLLPLGVAAGRVTRASGNGASGVVLARDISTGVDLAIAPIDAGGAFSLSGLAREHVLLVLRVPGGEEIRLGPVTVGVLSAFEETDDGGFLPRRF